ncbi:MAG: DUF2975 domain-containing protein [Beijerinckiaceae bacterium]
MHPSLPAQAPPHKTGRYDSIARIAFLAEWTSVAGIVMLLGAAVYLSLDSGRLLEYLARDAPSTFGTPSKTMVWLAGMLALVPTILLVFLLWQVRTLFRLYALKQVFTPAIPEILVRLGYLAFGAAAAGIVTRTIIILLLTIGNPAGQRHLAVGISAGEIMGLVAGFLFLAFSLVVKESLRIAAENESFV